MKIAVGSQNKTKIHAVHDAIALYPTLFPNPEISGVSIRIPEFGHPKNLRQTVKGAVTRAKKAFRDCDYSIGLEGGLMKVPYSKSGFMEVGVCAIFDGEKIYLGLSPAFEWPTKVTELILSKQADASQAFTQLGLTPHKKLGNVTGGAIGFLTEQKLTREDFTKYSIIMALIQLEKPTLYA